MPAPLGFNPAAAQAALTKAKAIKFKGEEEEKKEKEHAPAKRPILRPLAADLFHKKV